MLNLNLKYGLSITFIICLICLGLLTWCSSVTAVPTTSATETVTASGTPSSPTTASSVYSVAVFFNGKQVAALTRDDLANLKQVSITASGNPQNGPTLLSALQKSGITDFIELTAYGLTRGRIASAQLTLKREQVDDSVVLDLNNRGKCKLCGVNIPQDNWIIDLEKLDMK